MAVGDRRFSLRFGASATRVFAVGLVLVAILSVYNAVFIGEFGPFLVALIFILTRSGFLFARMLITGFGGRPAA